MEAERQRFEALYEAHGPAVLGYALRRSDRTTADDVLADVFLVVWRRLGDVPAEPRAWLLGTARKVLANHRRSADRQTALGDRLIHERPEQHDAAAPADDPAILVALARLGARDREALLLVAWDGLTPRAAAESLGLRTPAFTMRLSRARRRLAALLAEPSGGSAVPTPTNEPCRSEASRA